MTRKLGPVFHVAFEGSGDAGAIKPKAVGTVRFRRALSARPSNSRRGGCFVYPHRKDFELDGEFAVEFWFREETLDQQQILASCGEYARNGWFVQIFGGRIRFSLGGARTRCGAHLGRQVASPCLHLRRADDAQFLDGKVAGAREASTVDFTPWTGPLYVAQYHSLTDDFQFRGLLDELKMLSHCPHGGGNRQGIPGGKAAVECRHSVAAIKTSGWRRPGRQRSSAGGTRDDG